MPNNKKQQPNRRHRTFMPPVAAQPSESRRDKRKNSPINAQNPDVVANQLAAFIQRYRRQWTRLSTSQQCFFIFLVLAGLSLSGVMLYSLFSGLPLPNTQALKTDATGLPSAFPTGSSPVFSKSIAKMLSYETGDNVHATSSSAQTERTYLCPKLPFFQINKISQDKRIVLQQQGCSITPIDSKEKRFRHAHIEVELRVLTRTLSMRSEIIKKYDHLNDEGYQLLQRVLISKIAYEVAAQLGISRCESSASGAIYKIIQAYMTTQDKPCPIIYMISAQGDCAQASDDHATHTHLLIQDHAFLVMVDASKIATADRKAILMQEASPTSMSLDALMAYKPEICDPWQGQELTYQLLQIPEKNPDGTYPLWHPRSWHSTSIIAMFYMPDNDEQQALIRELVDEASSLSMEIKQGIADVIKSELRMYMHDQPVFAEQMELRSQVLR